MASFKHDVLKNVLNVMSLPMYWKLPPIKHLRSVLEASTMLSTLPWGITFESHDFGTFKAECLTPIGSDPDKVILYLHGGGYVIGSPHTHRALAGKISKGTGLNCLVIDYRKAPENPYPAALDDAIAAYLYLIEEKLYKPENIIVIGDSAGGGLTVALQYALRDFQLPLPRASVLLSPYLDLAQKGRSIKQNAKNDRFLDVFEMRKWAKLYATYHDLKNPYISPLYGDLRGLPPMLIQASESEVLYDDARRLVQKARKARVEVHFQVWSGLIHWWHMFSTMPESKEAIDKIVDFVNERLAHTQAKSLKKTA
jgi:acetyl esterase/lipase